MRTLPFTGTLKAVHSAAVKARVAGELRELELREGDPVRAGQLLARIDATEALARVQQAEQQALASEAQQGIAQRQHDNNQALVLLELGRHAEARLAAERGLKVAGPLRQTLLETLDTIEKAAKTD